MAAAAMAARRWSPASIQEAISSTWSRYKPRLDHRDLEDPRWRAAAAEQLLALINQRHPRREGRRQLATDHDDRVRYAVIHPAAELLQPLRDVYGIADQGIIHPPRGADVTHHRRPFMDADADA